MNNKYNSGATPEDDFLADRIEAVYTTGHSATATNLALAALATAVMWTFVSVAWLAIWLGSVTLTLAVRWWILAAHSRSANRMLHAADWGRRLTLALGLSGTVWGLASAFFYIPEQPLLMAFWAIMVCGIAAGVVHATAFHLPTQRVYLATLLLPLTLRHGWDGGVVSPTQLEHAGIAFGMLAYYVFCMTQGRHIARNIVDSMAMRHEKDQLLLALQMQTAEAEKARDLAQEAGQAKARFFAAASHDLRQPLQALGHFSNALQHTKLSAAQTPLVSHMNEGVESLNRLFDGILGIAELDAALKVPVSHPVDLAALIHRVIALHAPLASAKGLRLKTWRVVTPLTVLSDATALERILNNLVSNAVRYTDEGWVVVAVRHTKHGPALGLQLQVRDSGRGIDAIDQPRVFDEFYQVGNAMRDHSRGVGLGLATVKRLCDSLGIVISLKSRHGKGSCFSLSLMAGLQPAQQPAPQLQQEKNLLAGRRVCIIASQTADWAQTQALLVQWGMAVQVSETLIAPVGPINADDVPQALMCPEWLGGVDANELIADFRNSWGQVVPALILAATGRESEDKNPDIHLPATYRITQPIKPARLRSTLLHVLARPD